MRTNWQSNFEISVTGGVNLKIVFDAYLSKKIIDSHKPKLIYYAVYLPVFDSPAKLCAYFESDFKQLLHLQELVVNAVLKLQGSIIDNKKMSGLLSETQINIEHHRLVLHELHYQQVYVSFMLHFFIFFYIQFWYLRCCGCPGLRGRQHLAMTCHNTEAGFLTGWLLWLSPNSEVTASETPPFLHLGCVPAVVPAKGGSSA